MIILLGILRNSYRKFIFVSWCARSSKTTCPVMKFSGTSVQMTSSQWTSYQKQRNCFHMKTRAAVPTTKDQYSALHTLTLTLTLNYLSDVMYMTTLVSVLRYIMFPSRHPFWLKQFPQLQGFYWDTNNSVKKVCHWHNVSQCYMYQAKFLLRPLKISASIVTLKPCKISAQFPDWEWKNYLSSR